MVQNSLYSVVPFIERSSIYLYNVPGRTHRKLVKMLDGRRAVSGRQKGAFS